MKNRGPFLACLAAYLSLLSEFGPALKLLVFTSSWLATGGARWCYLFYHTCGREFKCERDRLANIIECQMMILKASSGARLLCSFFADCFRAAPASCSVSS